MDIDQYFKMKLGDGVLKFMEGNLPFQNLIFGKREGTDLYWFQVNGYNGDGTTAGQRYICTPKPTVITFTCDKAPQIKVEEGKGERMTTTRKWDKRSKTVTLNFDHTDGAVNFTITSGTISVGVLQSAAVELQALKQ
jgi:hypothetical protein